jgi:hypothetical protein
LSGTQVVAAYQAILGASWAGGLSTGHLARLSGLEGLTAADLALVRRNHALLGRGRTSHDELISDLEAEVAHKRRDHIPRIGFAPTMPPVLVTSVEPRTNRKEASCL